MIFKELLHMNLTRLLVLALGASLGLAFAAETGGGYAGTIWSAGVNQDAGWYDVDKSMDDARDDMMCYAASASNLITWWQNGYYGSQLTSSAPKSLADTWNLYLDYSQNTASGGDPLAAFNWWISGVYAPTSAAEAERSVFNQLQEDSPMLTLMPFDGFYFDQYGLNREHLMEFFSFTTDYSNSYFGDLLTGGAGVSLLLKSDTGNLAHVITLWGVDYSDDGLLSRLWITDSDDASHELATIDVVTAENGKVYFDEEGDIGFYEYQKYLGITGIHIYGVSAVHPDATTTWQLIPEPGSVMLGLLALAVSAVRRRRVSC
jgi:MYXO-CTERM domain-containing protein